MENFGDEYRNYWETNKFLQSEKLDSCYLDEAAISAAGYYDSSSPDGIQSKNIASERMRRKKLNDKLYALRSVVPNITKMDKASIIRDAISYIQSLHNEEKFIQAEISELESYELNNWSNESPINKRTRFDNINCSNSASSGLVMPSPIELLELRVVNMGDRIIVVSLTCGKRADTMVRLCEMFESLNLKIITANINTFSEKLSKTVFIKADEEEKDVLRLKIENAIASMNGPASPMSI
ncbi:basic helix-loop-helix (bHLH) DNA-bindingsuperfamily protein [Striga asiatica]|uniref:Basic helix-loop-helix (BHLH) DNA-bindingsuperfamily protein n=1 Tax=Striga asiatica TaxID=4170 RepID=A0A5A7Q9B9_STRAF|nr:basic helix-loop-helix (bHLH) DNA-bindingsuperfamily protein [Striga asiatica]